MLIDNIEYALRFWIDDEEDNMICDEVFMTFEEMNRFLKAISRDEKYLGLTAQFSPVEVVNGQPDEAVKFIFDICPIMELLEDEIEDFICDIKADFQMSQELAERSGADTAFTPGEESADYEAKRKHRAEFTYICPHCFREIDDCRCAVYPYHLVQIDTLIVPIIRVLNQKGYITTSCCSGHLEEKHCDSIYVAFKSEHHFKDNIPKGALYLKSQKMIRYDGLLEMSKEERRAFQAQCLNHLTAWADSLPNVL